jgi:drug/metabolite transporter (DMT)-like permease
MIRFLAVLGILGISFSAVFVRLAEVSPATAAFFRAGYALPPLFLLWMMTRGGDHRSASMRWMAAGSGLFLALDLTVWHRSIELIGAGLATVLANTQIVFVGLIAWAIHRERPTALAFATVPIVFGGVVLISGLGRADAYGDDPLAGAALGVVTGMAYTGFLLVFRASNRELAPPAGPLLDATAGTAIGALAAGALFDGRFSLAPSWPEHGWLLALALVAQVAGWMLIAAALPRVPALETSVLLLIQPMATVVWGLIIFAEDLSVVQWAGVALVLGGVAVLTLRGSVERPATAPAEP